MKTDSTPALGDHPLARCTLFVSLRSPYARRVRVAFLELGLPYQEELADVLAPSAALVAVNPLARVPALRTRDGATLVESQLILEQLLAPLGAGAARLRPTGGPARARADLVTGLSLGLCDKAIEWFFEHLRPAPTRDAALLDEIRGIAARTFAALEAQLAGTPLDQEAPAAAWDLGIALAYWDLRVDRGWRAGHPRLADLAARLDARESFRKTAPPPPA